MIRSGRVLTLIVLLGAVPAVGAAPARGLAVLAPAQQPAQDSAGTTYTDDQGTEVRFELGDRSFADQVVAFEVGSPAPRDAQDREPRMALGPPTRRGGPSRFITLGCGGTLTLRFTDNALTDVEGPDLHVFEGGGAVEPTQLAISTDGRRWIEVGRVAGGTAQVDIAGHAEPGARYHYVRLTDLRSACGGRTPGADINAVGAIGAVRSAPARIAGTVRYAGSGRPVRRTVVELLDEATSARVARAVIQPTDSGRYALEDLAPGDYTVTVGGSLSPYTPESAIKGASELAAGEERTVDFALDPARVTVDGGVYAVSAKNRKLPIIDAAVTVTFDTGDTLRATTDRAGYYRVRLEQPAQRYTLAVALAQKDSIFTVRSRQGFNGDVVTLTTRALDVERPSMRTDIAFAGGYAHLPNGISAGRKRALRDAGVYYANTYTAMDFARNTLGLAYDHELPVGITMHIPNSDDASYEPPQSEIEIGADGNTSSIRSNDAPDNREYHEFGHHVHEDSDMGGRNDSPGLAAGDSWHGGVDNGSSMASVSEGFAEFFSMAAEGDTKYRWSGSVTDLQDNFHRLSGSRKPDEEFNVASLLWDLADDDSTEMGDAIALGVKGAWNVLDRTSIKTVRDLYVALQAAGVGQDSLLADDWTPFGPGMASKGDTLLALDALFILHGFFSDANGNGTYEKGTDQPGYADFHSSRAARRQAPRSQRPPVPGTLLDFTALDVNDAELDVPRFAFTVGYPEDRAEDAYTYLSAADPTTGHLRVDVPAGADRVEILPELPGYDAEPLVIRPDSFHAAVLRAQEDGADIFDSHTFRLASNGVPQPTQASAGRLANGDIRVAWSYDGVVTLVHGIGATPAHVDDGEVLFTGSAEAYVHEAPITGIAHGYTVFGTDGERLSQGVAVTEEPDGAGGGDAGSRLRLLLLVGLGIAGLLLLLGALRRRKEEEPAAGSRPGR